MSSGILLQLFVALRPKLLKVIRWLTVWNNTLNMLAVNVYWFLSSSSAKWSSSRSLCCSNDYMLGSSTNSVHFKASTTILCTHSQICGWTIQILYVGVSTIISDSDNPPHNGHDANKSCTLKVTHVMIKIQSQWCFSPQRAQNFQKVFHSLTSVILCMSQVSSLASSASHSLLNRLCIMERYPA